MNNKAKVWLAGGLAAAVAVFALGYFIVVKPKGDDVTTKKAEVATLQASNATLQSQIDQLLAQSKQIVAKQQELTKVADRIPSDAALPSLIRRLSQDATNSDVDLVSFTPTPPVAATAYGTGAAAYQQVGMTMEVRGTYAALHEWFTHLEDPDKRLIVVENLSLTEPRANAVNAAVVIGPDGIPEANNALTATIAARTFLTAPTTTTADLPALASVPSSGGAAPSTTSSPAPTPNQP